MPSDFDKQSYWHDRFQSETSFEWLVSSEMLLRLLEPYLRNVDDSSAAAGILHLGSGTSSVHTLLRANGFLNVTNIDYEPLAIERGRSMEKALFGDVRMKYAVADATALSLPGKYDLVIDKSTADAVSCAGGAALLEMANSVKGCLADGGAWVSVSYSSSRYELDALPFHVEVIAAIPTPKTNANDPDIFNWCYLLRPKD